MSLRARILLLAIGIALLIIVLAGIPIAVMMRTTVYDHAAEEARDAAQASADYLSTGQFDDELLAQYLARANDRSRVQVTVVMGDGDVLGAALPAGVETPPATGARPHHEHDRDPRYTDLDNVSTPQTTRTTAGDTVATVSVGGPQGRDTVYAVNPADHVQDEVRDRYLLIAGAAVFLLAFAGLAAEVTSRRLVRPLRQTAATAERLSRGDLLARAPTTGPSDVAQVAIELNALADRIDELLASERETIADLSHRLRTPMTAIRLSVEALPPGELTTELEAHVAALERTLTQVIRDARRPQREGVHPRCDAREVVSSRVAFWQPLAEDQGRDVDVSIADGDLHVRAAREDLADAVDALVENVLAHTPEGTAFAVCLGLAGTTVLLDVLDAGDGVSPEALARGRSDRGSTGLGLDIARSVAESAGGGLELVTAETSGMSGMSGVRLRMHVSTTGAEGDLRSI
ncbi:HAMP domain-containing sensor histidine kinase [Gordonia sp. VNQ95]|uniref:HAMP domain-containing sensor histidine kinase n=1 Tax=Gordonia sp. VNQ95 TaxID=3156619 RepID=UPI0032B32BA6